MDGEDVVILAYGSSRTGKTYTMTGLRNGYDHRGIAPRLINDLFLLKKELEKIANINIYISFLEFVGNTVHNLLKSQPNTVSLKNRPAPITRCDNEEKATRLIFEGECRRHYEKEFVSCSTTVITFFVDIQWLSRIEANFRSKIHLVDTAGIENIKSKVRSPACQITSNMTMCWIDYVLANASYSEPDSERPVIVRASQLTEFIGPTLLNGNIRLIGHIQLEKKDLLPTLSTLKFGNEIKKRPSPELVYARKPNQILLIQMLQDQNRHLRDEILLNELLKGEYTEKNMSEEEYSHVQRLVESYLQNKINETSVLSVVSPTVLLPMFKKLHNNEKEEASAYAVRLRCRLDEAKIKLEDALWRRKATLGTIIGPDGKEIQSETEKQAIIEVDNLTKEFVQARKLSASAHGKYVELAIVFNDINETVRLEFQDYVNKVYTTTLVLPELGNEDISAKYLEPVPEITDENQDNNGENEKSRLYFEHLQRLHGRNLIIKKGSC